MLHESHEVIRIPGITAGKAGRRTVGMLCGGWPEEELRRSGCIAIYHDRADLFRRYGDSPLAG